MIHPKRLSPRPTPSRYPIITPYQILRSDRCINCGTCIQVCIYDCHFRSEGDPRIMADPMENGCRNCFACIKRCPRDALSMQKSEEYLALGNGTYTPDRIRTISEQAEQGKIPVSGAGFRGYFDGDYYDNIWTDMSEIVRPTRDGIHGREHISTTVALGQKAKDLCGMVFDKEGNLKSHIPLNREIPIPIIFGLMPFFPGHTALSSLALAASKLTTYLTIPAKNTTQELKDYYSHLMIRLNPNEVDRYRDIIEWATIVEFDPDRDPIAGISRVRDINPNVLTIIHVPVSNGTDKKILELARNGAETIHMSTNIHGRGHDGMTLLESLHATHSLLVEKGLRDRITLVASGGIAAAEHVPKTIIMGADAIVLDVPLLIAMDVVKWVPRETGDRNLHPKGIEELDPRWGASRIINLMLSWRDQLLEVLGAMGLRDVRRLRGETGRAIFADKERQNFCEMLKTKPEKVAKIVLMDPQRGLDEPLPHIKAKRVPDRFGVNPGEWRVVVDRSRCTNCNICSVKCEYDVHRRIDGKRCLDEPIHSRCIGPSCKKNDWCCVLVCPWDALDIGKDTADTVLGDPRWTPALLHETYRLSRTGSPTKLKPEERIGASRGGFDRILLATSVSGNSPAKGPVDLSIPLNRRKNGPKVRISLPIYGGGMSYGSISLNVMLGRAMAAKKIGSFTCTGEGGYPEELVPYSDFIITQVATGLFGVREETIKRARMIEFKYAQGAKPGLGGHLLGEKNTPEVASMREAVTGTNLFSPFPFHSVYSVEDHKKHVDWIRSIHPDVLVSVKVSTPSDVDMVAVGSYYAGANVIHLDGAYGGTGAAPDIAKKNIAMPIEYATAQTHEFLKKEGIRDEVVLIASGGIRTSEDILKAIALGADGVVIGTAELVAIDCVRCGNCERDRGCPIGIATTDPELAPQMTDAWVCDRICNLYKSLALDMEKRLRNLGMNDINQMRGRWDLLDYWVPSR
ncbi:MAG: alpha-hydroxy-acid oxidizing protein [Candidatus Aminicenantes bacterium]|nr:MAG: alpha-hydroxy-acid oxidizing protein [Candidatus Aminicenantes bacterium]